MQRRKMETGRFYFVSDSFYERFKECGLVDNKAEKYVLNEYIDTNTKQPITIPKKLMTELHKKARKKIRFNQQGKRLGLSDTMKIYNELIKDT